MPVLNTNLNIRLTDGVSGPAKVVARSLVNIKDAALGLNGKSFGAGLVKPLREAEIQMGALATRMRSQAQALRKDIEGVSHGFHGIGTALATLGVGHGMVHVLGDGAELNRELLALKNAGRTTQEIAEGFRGASETIRKLPTTSLTENIKLLNETTGAFGNFQHALENLTFNAKLGSVMKSAFGDKFGDEGKAFNDLVRAFEIRGTAFDPHKYQEEAGRLSKAMIFTRGNVNPEQFLTFAQRANPSIKGFSTEFLTEIAPSLIQTFGGDQAGTGITAFEKVIKGGLTDKSQAKEWVRLGLISQKTIQSNGGQSPGWRSGQLAGTNLGLSNPLDFMEKIVLPAIKRSGVDIMDPVALGKELDILFKNKRAQATAYELGQAVTRAALRKDQRLIKIVPDLDAQYESNLSDVYTALRALKEGFKDVFASLSLQFMKPAAKGIVFMARQLQEVAATIAEHPLLAKKLGLAAAVGGAVTGLASLRASLNILGLVGLNPIKAMKSTFLEIGAFMAGAGAAGLRTLRLGFLGLVNPIATAKMAAAGLRFVLRGAVAATGIGALLLGGEFILKNWKGIEAFFSSFGDTLKKSFGDGSLMAGIVDGTSKVVSKLGDLVPVIDPQKWSAWGAAAGEAVAGILKQMGALVTEAAAVGGKIIDAIKNQGWVETGKAVAISIAQGLRDALLQAVQSLMGEVRGMLPSFLGGGASPTSGSGAGGSGSSIHNRLIRHGTLGAYSVPSGMSDDELAIRIAHAEGGGEGIQGEEAILHVIKNRAESGKHGKTWGDVIREPHQFSALHANDPARKQFMGLQRGSAEWMRLSEALARVKAGGKDPTNGATHYYNPAGGFGMTRQPKWADPDHQTKIGHHVFQKERQSNAAPYQPTIHVHVANAEGMDHRRLGDRIAEQLHKHYEDALGASYADTGFA